VTVIAGGFVITMGIAPAASACVDLTRPGGPVWVTPAAYRPGPAVRPILAAYKDFNNGRGNDRASIVGLWQFEFISKGNANNPPPQPAPPDGVPLDSGFTQWHGDRTEIMNSSRDPVTSNFCLGVWATDGPRTYTLNHYALSWDDTGMICTPEAPATNCLVGAANIRERVTLDPGGDTYHGTVKITQYDTAGHEMFSLTGTVSARRITAK
jgi:hypothetical protein